MSSVAGASLDIIILNFRSPRMTADTVRSALNARVDSHERRIWIVDNGSGDDSATFLRELFPGIQVIESQRNLGFAGGNNLALVEIMTEDTAGPRDASFVLLVNSDVDVEPNAIQLCLDVMERDPNIGIVGPRVMLPNGDLDLACRRGFPTPSSAFWKLTGLSRRYPNNPRFAGYNLTYLPDDEAADVDAVGGAFMLVRKSAIDQVGLLDERYFMYGEDLDWCYRIKATGWKVRYHPEARVVHLKSASARRAPVRMIYEFYRAMWLFHGKHYAAKSPFLVNLLVMIGIVARGLLALIVNGFRSTERKRFA